MSQTEAGTGGGTTARRRGRPAQIDRDAIVAAARGISPAELTMQAVADRLGVGRKALHYHVGDRDGLLHLVALDAMESTLRAAGPLAEGDWPQVLRSYATALRNSVVAVGALFDYARLPGLVGSSALSYNERLLQTLILAGFDDETASRACATVAELTYTSARDAILAQEHGDHPQITEIRRALEEASAADFPAVRRMLQVVRIGTDEQFAFDLDIVIAGLEQRLAGGR